MHDKKEDIAIMKEKYHRPHQSMISPPLLTSLPIEPRYIYIFYNRMSGPICGLNSFYWHGTARCFWSIGLWGGEKKLMMSTNLNYSLKGLEVKDLTNLLTKSMCFTLYVCIVNFEWAFNKLNMSWCSDLISRKRGKIYYSLSVEHFSSSRHNMWGPHN